MASIRRKIPADLESRTVKLLSGCTNDRETRKVQLCIVHMIRNSLKYVGWKEKKQIAADLKSIYNAPTTQAAKEALDQFAQVHDKEYPAVSQIWYRHWDNIIPFFDYPQEIRKVIYTTNAIESLNSSFRKISRNPVICSQQKRLYIDCSI